MQKIDGEIKGIVDDATKKAKADVEIGADELTADIYAKELVSDVRGTTPFVTFKHKRIGPAVNLSQVI